MAQNPPAGAGDRGSMPAAADPTRRRAAEPVPAAAEPAPGAGTALAKTSCCREPALRSQRSGRAPTREQPRSPLERKSRAPTKTNTAKKHRDKKF